MANHTMSLQFSHFSIGSSPLIDFLQQEAGLHFLLLLLFTLSIGRVLCQHWGELCRRRCRICVSVLDPQISSYIACFTATALLYPLLNNKEIPRLQSFVSVPKLQGWHISTSRIKCKISFSCSKSMPFGKFRDEASAQLGSTQCSLAEQTPNKTASLPGP